ncbi:hypothetical protein [Aurantiacibacter suaedae]|uniref:hypothetical protein n=1 Tax=Aurantiacibacter suaedae TaxID=2545755 RepID=UPI0010F87DC8|nr:hypothetical protein [Aurantiacibacter suaedae]
MTDKNELAPEVHNSEQDDAPTQAQSVADRAGEIRQQMRSPTESTKGPNETNVLGGSKQDLVDHMRDMESSGRIDMNAFRGEPAHDDDESLYKPSRRPEDDS